MAAFGKLLHELLKCTRPAVGGGSGYVPSYALTRTTSAPPTRLRGAPPALLVLVRGCRSADSSDHPTMEQACKICQRVLHSVTESP